MSTGGGGGGGGEAMRNNFSPPDRGRDLIFSPGRGRDFFFVTRRGERFFLPSIQQCNKSSGSSEWRIQDLMEERGGGGGEFS